MAEVDDAAATAAAAKKKADDEAAAAAAARASQSDEDEDDDDGDEESGLNKVDQIVKNMIEDRGGSYRRNSPEAQVIRKMVFDSFKLRQKNAKLRAKVAGDGDVIIRKGAEAEAVVAWKALGLTAAQIKEKLEQRDTFEGKLKTYERDTFFSDVADGLGYTGRGKKAFIRAAQKEGIDIQLKEVTVEDEESGKKIKEMQPFAKLATESDDKLRPIDQLIEEELGDYLPAFEAEGSDDPDADDDQSSDRRTRTAARRVTPMVTQSRTSRDDKTKRSGGVVQKVLAQRYALPEKKKS